MNDEQNLDFESSDEVVQSEAEQVEAAEAPESTEGQVEDQTADDTEADTEAEDASPDEEENVSKSKARRERQKAYIRELEGKARELDRLKQVTQKDSPAPVESDFEDYDDYRIAKALHQQQQASRKERAEALTAEQTQIQRIREAEKQALWSEQVQEASKRHQDFEQVALRRDLPVTPVMAEIIQASDAGADVLYHLGGNPAEAARIAQLPPLEAARQLGRIEAQLAAPQPKTETKAPPPITPVRGTASPKNPSSMSYSEFKAWREKGGTF